MGRKKAEDSGGVAHLRGYVLVADDLAIFRRALVRQLQLLGIDARGVASLKELLEHLEVEPPRAVLLDWHFGGCTAEDVLLFLRSRWIPTIVLTGDPESVGTTGVPVLGKPVELRLLRDQLAEILCSQEARAGGGHD